MDLSLLFPGGGRSEYTGTSTYTIKNGGSLVVINETGLRTTFAPHAWNYVVDQVPERAEILRGSSSR